MLDDKKNEDLKKISSIHTLESDLASAVMDNNYGKNIIKIITDPNKKITSDSKSDEEGKPIGSILTKKNIFIFLIFIVLISSISVILYILYKVENPQNVNRTEELSTTTDLELKTNQNQPLIKYNDILKPEIIQSSDFSKLNKSEIILEIDRIRKTLIDKKVDSNINIGINSNLNVRELFEKIRYSGNNSLLNSFSDTYAFGLYSNENKQLEHYLLVEINDFDLSFSSVLTWEKYMPNDLKNIFIGNNEIIKILNVENISTSTVNSTSSNLEITEKKYYKKDTDVFVDRVFKNHDIREYVNNSNNITLIYGFINNKFLLITSGESSFLDIKNRLLKENIVR